MTGQLRLTARRLDVEGTAVATFDAGPVEARAVVLVHGWGSSAATWSRVVPHLEADWRVVAFDIRGHGGSEPGGEPATIARIARDIQLLTAQLGISRAAIVGHSLGGTIATEYAVTRRDVAGLVVVDPSYGAEPEEMAGVGARFETYARSGGIVPAQGVDAAFGAEDDRSLVLEAAHSLLAADPTALASLFASNYLEADAFGSTPAALRHLAGRRPPTLAFYPTEERAAVDRRLGEAEIEIWPAAGHFLHLHDPARFGRRLRGWLESLAW